MERKQVIERTQVLAWAREHPAAIHGDPEQVLERCEQAVRRHAEEDAWHHAERIAQRQIAYWQRRLGSHASEAFVANELCHRLAREMRHLAPQPDDGDLAHFTGAEVLEALEAEALPIVRQWVHDLASAEERRLWREIVRFTDRRGRALLREGRVARGGEWSETPYYSESAVKVLQILASDYSEHAAGTPGGAAS
jgi:hypothetical protein